MIEGRDERVEGSTKPKAEAQRLLVCDDWN